ncbi:MAG: carboxylate--amine ligase [Nitrospiraceae bacterium]
MKVLLTDGDQRAALAATRALGGSGIETFVGESYIPNLAAMSRHCAKAVVYPSPFLDEKGFVECVSEIAKRYAIDLIIPVTDVTSAILAEQRSVLEKYTQVAVVDVETFWRASDKNALCRLADRIGIPTPTLSYIEHPDEVLQYADKVEYPCVVKPARARIKTGGKWLRTSVYRVSSKSALLQLFENNVALSYPCMIQKEIRGEGYGIFVLCEKGEIVMKFAHRRLREKPPWGGVSVLRESIRAEQIMEQYAQRLLRELQWHGVGMVEFKRETNSGGYYLMEINGRLWGSLQLAIDSGLNFPFFMVQLYKGGSVSAPQDYRIGIRSRWLLGDVDHLLARFRGKEESADHLPSLRDTLKDFMKFYQPNTYNEIESWDDPWPSVHEAKQYLLDGLRGLVLAKGGNRDI